MSTPLQGAPLHDALVCDRLAEATLTCQVCDAEAEWRIITRCCTSLIVILCDRHLQRTRDDADQFLTEARHAYCIGCGFTVPPAASFDDVYRTVRL